ncbi:MAG: DUF262 domain-containing protein [Gammaproteobacteria bacterium]|nr:DUF262 domain-containing protein [Gammaproteobacteria bacterium]
MKSETIAVLQLYQDRRQYRVPFYQRAYVWNREDQWERLWADIQDKAEGRISGSQPTPHFLGAAVLEPQQRRGLLGVEALHIIDGQQRLTTLQYVLAALAIVLRGSGPAALLSLVEGCLTNPNSETMEQPDTEVFKVWPTFRDRSTYKVAMLARDKSELREAFPDSFTQVGGLRKIGIDHPPALEAIWYFNEQMTQWIDQENGAHRAERITAIVEAVLKDLNMVTISLGEDDDAQVIFETLNGHGAQLHATDLIRNFVFMRADREGANAGQLYDALWSPFESTFWSEEQRRGRLKRPRLEWFIQTALQAALGEEVDVGRLYVGYRRFAVGRTTPVSASDQLRILNEYSEHYRQLVSGSGDTPIARFGRQVAAWDASTMHPLALAVAMSGCPEKEQAAMYADIESYLVRRAVCGLTTKNYNKVFIQQLKNIASEELKPAVLRKALAGLQGEASRWPREDEFRKSWLEAAMYPGRLDAVRTKSILASLERKMRSSRTEEPLILAIETLDVDHILPSSWLEHWPLEDGTLVTREELEKSALDVFLETAPNKRSSAIQRRESAKVRIGNLTLLHYGVNRGLQNQGIDRKREALFAESNLHLNRKLMRAHEWNEDSIDQRGRELFEFARELWQGP